jgi:exopolysaccharide production protein ExoZ
VNPIQKRVKASIPREFQGVQALRGLAACMVVVYHSTQTWSTHVGSSSGTWFNGLGGVDVFFVVSGFVMTVSTIEKRNGRHPARDFMERRLVRIVPMYWLMTALTLLKAYAVRLQPKIENIGPHASVTLGYIVSSLLFVPYRNSLGFVQPILSVGWTLSFEMFFYLLFACALALRISEIRLLAPVMIALAALGLWHGDFGSAIGVLASPLLLEFLAGVAIGRAIEEGWRVRPGIAAAVGVLSAGALLALPPSFLFGIDWLTRGTFAVLLVLCAVMLETQIAKRMPRWALAIGDASYSLYLVHLLLFAIILKPVLRLGLLAPGSTHFIGELATVLLFAAPSILISLGVYRWIEAPINNALRRQLKLRNARMQPVVP